MDLSRHSIRFLSRAALVLALWGTGMGPGHALQSVDLRVSGDDEALETALTGASLLSALLAEDDAVSPGDAVAAAQADYANLLEVLYAQGHYGAVIRISVDGREAATIPPLDPPTQTREAVITVDPGPVYALGQARIAPLAPGEAPSPAMRAGEPAAADAIRGAAREAVDGWRQQGHAKATVEDQSIVARHTRNELDVDIAISPGRQARIGDVTVSGETRVRPARIRQIAGIPEGDVFDPDTISKGADRLRATGTFRSITVREAETIKADGTLDFNIEAVDRAPRRITAGIELSTLDGLTLSTAWLHRNILGGAERLRLDGEVTQIGGGTGGPDLTLGARFEKPAVYGPDTSFFALANLHYLDEPDFLDRGGEIGLGVSRTFSETLSGDLGLSLSYAHVTDRYLGRDANGDFPTRQYTLFSMPGALTWNRRDDDLDATTGTYLRLEAEPFTYLTGTGAGGARLAMDARAYQPLGGAVLAGRLQLGSVIGPEARDAPADFLFYSGGGGTVRGQPFRSLDADYDGTRLGGRGFAAVSGEVRAPVTDALSLVAFADAGYVAPNSDLSDGTWHSGAGLGLRYDTTIGPIRVDIAGPIGGDTGDGVQLYIGIGQAF